MSVVPSVSHRNALEEALRGFETNLWMARDYLTGRGLTAETCRRFRLGVVGPGETKWYPGRLCLPYLSPAGVVDLKFRALDNPPTGKYLYPVGGTEHRLFNAAALLEPSTSYVITEGELDAMSVSQATCMPCVSYPGTSGWKPSFTRAFYGCAEVIVVADGDQPGREAAREVARKIGLCADTVRIVDLDDGMDMNRILAEHGPEAVKEVLA